LLLARLTTIKTIAGFDFTFQPSPDRNRILALAAIMQRLDSYAPHSSVHA
jgi:hypothetical protein